MKQGQGARNFGCQAITLADLKDCLKAKHANEGAIIGVGLPFYSLLQALIYSIKS